MSPMPQFPDEDSPTDSPQKIQNGEMSCTEPQVIKPDENNEKLQLDSVENGLEVTESPNPGQEDHNG